MASDEDFTWNDDTEELLTRMRDELHVVSPMDMPADMVAGIVWLDDARGLRRDGDYILLNPAVAGWLMMEVETPDEEITAMMAELAETDELTDEQEAHYTELTSKPFAIKFGTDGVPANIAGQEVLVAFMTDADMESDQIGSFAVSLRADGTLVGSQPVYQRAI